MTTDDDTTIQTIIAQLMHTAAGKKFFAALAIEIADDRDKLRAENERLKKDKREFAIQVGYEVTTWIDANDPIPDVSVIVDEMLAKEPK